MNDVIAANIRNLREQRAWTQEHLAGVAGITVRTIQRAESGELISADTLMAIASAFDVTVDQLRLDPMELLASILGVPVDQVTPELIAEKIKEARAKFATVSLATVTTSADLSPIWAAEAMHFECLSSADEAQDIAAELKDWLADVLDIVDCLDSVQRRDQLKSIFAVVERLRVCGCSVSIGSRDFAYSGSPTNSGYETPREREATRRSEHAP